MIIGPSSPVFSSLFSGFDQVLADRLAANHVLLNDPFGLVPVEDFDDLIDMLDELGVIVYKNMKIMTKFHKTQADFDIRVAERLHMDKVLDDGNDDRGVYQ